MANKIKIIATSDFHANLPEKYIPEGDLFLIAGDIGPWRRGTSSVYTQANWYNQKFEPWIKRQPVKSWFACFGNHDFVGENSVKLLSDYLQEHFLTDRSVSAFGLNIHGTPWQKPFCNWAFNLEEDRLAVRWSLIPDNTNILLAHSPAEGICDFTPYGSSSGEHIGSGTLLKRLYELPKLSLALWGHCHYSQNTHEIIRPENPILCANVALLNESYKMTGRPTIIEIEKEGEKIISTKIIEQEK